MVILKRGKARWGYTPPITVERHHGPLSDEPQERMTQLLWIPATLVSRLGAQYPALRSEADELFSVGVEALVAAIDSGKYPDDRLVSVCHERARRAMEKYANNLGSVVRIAHSTRWKRYRTGQPLPKTQGEPKPVATYDDMTDVIIRDACRPLGYTDLDKLTARQRNRLRDSVL